MHPRLLHELLSMLFPSWTAVPLFNTPIHWHRGKLQTCNSALPYTVLRCDSPRSNSDTEFIHLSTRLSGIKFSRLEYKITRVSNVIMALHLSIVGYRSRAYLASFSLWKTHIYKKIALFGSLMIIFLNIPTAHADNSKERRVNGSSNSHE